MLRAAYLLTLKTLGWGYILRHVFDPAREQLLHPNIGVIDVPAQSDPTKATSAPLVLLAVEPAEYRCVAVSFGQHMAFLPAPMDDGPFFESAAQRFRDFTSSATERELRGSAVEGTGPDMLFDVVPCADQFPGADYS